MDRFDRVVQSSRSVDITSGIELTLFRSPKRNIGIRKKLRPGDNKLFFSFISKKRSIINPLHIQNKIQSLYNRSSNCMCVAVVIGLQKLDKQLTKSHKLNIKQTIDHLDKIENDTGLSNLPLLSLLDLTKLDVYLQLHHRRTLTVLSLHSDKSLEFPFQIYYNSDSRDFGNLYILAHENHAYFISSIKKCLPNTQWCIRCSSPKFETECKCSHISSCKYCGSKDCVKEGDVPLVTLIYCARCNFYFLNSRCLLNHQNNDRCNTIHRCKLCCKTVKNDSKDHKCGLRYCKTCKAVVSMNTEHVCYIKRKHGFKSYKQYLVIDIETYSHSCVKGLLFYLFVCCPSCVNDTLSATTKCCSTRFHLFTGTDCVSNACNFIFFQKKFPNSVLISHNFSGYDGPLILQALLLLGAQNLNIVMKGTKIMTLSFNNVTARDTLLLMPYSLVKIAKSFGIVEGKSWFPYKILNPESLYLTLESVPPEHLFETHCMNDERLHDFKIWYDKKIGKKYNILKELSDYCKNDVIVLAKIIDKFTSMFLELCHINPIFSSITIASLCQSVYLHSYMPGEDEEGELPFIVLPDNDPGVAGLRQNSHMAIKYLSYLNQQFVHNGTNRKIVHAGNSKSERTICGQKVDGLVVSRNHSPVVVNGDCGPMVNEPNQVIQVHGCMIHSCVKCYPNRADRHPLKYWLTHHTNYLMTVKRSFDIINGGYELKVIWEHEIMAKLKHEASMASFFNDADKWGHMKDPISPRSSLHGGRCEVSYIQITK